ncbi:helix-turn-helix domain-containing protein [Noviluteimonas dokdonensis]|uniref:helix-turn-helix domain-containing protein n=1 Tax=Noviluteimonas dokdonensis TaxID=414050 RepID=UPI00055BCD07|nr:helix-turn-helix domain-containing protein [Lysobacter dokdonensis]
MTLSEDLRRFVVAKISSVAHLEALLLLRSTGTAWSLQELSARLYVSPSTASKLVEDLQSRGLAVRLGENAQYLPKSDNIAHAVDELSTMYGRSLIEVTRLIHATTERKARRFADAFDVRKDS